MNAEHVATGCGGPAGRAHGPQELESGTQLAGHIAHDINNLLSVISAGAEVLLRRVPADSVARQCLDDIRSAATRAVALTRQLLSVSLQENAVSRGLDANAVVADAEGMIRRLLGSDVRLSLELSPEPMVARGCAAHLERILMNLSANARDAMPSGGVLRIATHSTVDERAAPGARANEVLPGVLLTVTDTGCGMDKATLRRIFTPRFTTKGSRGRGLGLSTVHQLVAASGGWIDVESEIGAGPQFRIFLPRVDFHDAPKGGLSST